MGKLTRIDLMVIEALMESMQYDYIVIEYDNIDDEGQNEYDNPIVKQIMAME